MNTKRPLIKIVFWIRHHFPKNILPSVLIVFAASWWSGCAAPGSSITQAGISGRILDSKGNAQVGQKIEVGLPASYGLDAWDASTGVPQDYGHWYQHTNLVTDAQGRFSCLFSPVTYSIRMWLLPPLGAFPRLPPKPYVIIQPTNNPDFFVTGADQDHFAFRIWDHNTKKAMVDQSGRLTGSFSFVKPSKTDAHGRRFTGWQADVVITQP